MWLGWLGGRRGSLAAPPRYMIDQKTWPRSANLPFAIVGIRGPTSTRNAPHQHPDVGLASCNVQGLEEVEDVRQDDAEQYTLSTSLEMLAVRSLVVAFAP
jgi:hypothetical protein